MTVDRCCWLIQELRGAIARLVNREDGQGLTEYGLIITLVAIVAIASLAFFGGSVTSQLTTVARNI